jgi:two-component system cell cycle sensor histidine kinase/response regulator CckA
VYLPSLGAAITEQYTSKDSFVPAGHTGGAILVLDDEELIRNLTTEVLEHLGYQVRSCVDGKEAVLMYKTAKEAGTPFFAAIMDLTIPGGMGGQESAQHILNYDPSARLIVSSGYSNDPVIAEYGKYGFSAVITKPYTVDSLTEILVKLANAI